MAKLTEFSKTAKAWVGAAIAGLAGLSTFIVPDSTPGHLIASAIAFLVALGAVFKVSNEKDTPPVEPLDPRF